MGSWGVVISMNLSDKCTLSALFYEVSNIYSLGAQCCYKQTHPYVSHYIICYKQTNFLAIFIL